VFCQPPRCFQISTVRLRHPVPAPLSHTMLLPAVTSVTAVVVWSKGAQRFLFRLVPLPTCCCVVASGLVCRCSHIRQLTSFKGRILCLSHPIISHCFVATVPLVCHASHTGCGRPRLGMLPREAVTHPVYWCWCGASKSDPKCRPPTQAPPCNEVLRWGEVVTIGNSASWLCLLRW
jgi:hypothetical protein